MSPNTINASICLGVALLAFLGIVWLLRSHRQHQAVMRRMDQYNVWVQRLKTAPLEEQIAARPYLTSILMGANSEMRGPWESIDVPRD